jgi:hypothetical protein
VPPIGLFVSEKIACEDSGITFVSSNPKYIVHQHIEQAAYNKRIKSPLKSAAGTPKLRGD